MKHLSSFIIGLHHRHNYSQCARKSRHYCTLKEVKVKGKRKRKRTKPRVELNEYKVDVNAPSLIQALRAHLGTAKVRDNRVIVLNDRMYAPTSGNPLCPLGN